MLPEDGQSLSFSDQCKSLTICRRDDPDMAAVAVHLQRGTLRRMNTASPGFFRRGERGPACRGKNRSGQAHAPARRTGLCMLSLRWKRPQRRALIPTGQLGWMPGCRSWPRSQRASRFPSLGAARRAECTRRVKQRALARRKPGSAERQQAKRAVRAVHCKIKNTRRAYAHRVTAELRRSW